MVCSKIMFLPLTLRLPLRAFYPSGFTRISNSPYPPNKSSNVTTWSTPLILCALLTTPIVVMRVTNRCFRVPVWWRNTRFLFSMSAASFLVNSYVEAPNLISQRLMVWSLRSISKSIWAPGIALRGPPKRTTPTKPRPQYPKLCGWARCAAGKHFKKHSGPRFSIAAGR